MIDLRSDTVTVPTAAMRAAMAAAEVGDDVYGEDPTVRRLEELAAARVGKEAAVYVPSGTMANQLAILTHCQRGDRIFLEATAHIHTTEGGGAAVLAGATVEPLPGRLGRFSPGQLRQAVGRPAPPAAGPGGAGSVHARPGGHAWPARPALVCIEQTHNRSGGRCWPLAEIEEVAAEARRLQLAVHMDGARIFNAAAALGVPAANLAEPVDTVMFCVSKGLGAPVGSLLCGPAAFIALARRWRALLGGAMRQAGVIAAAGIVALEQMVDRLGEDHANARRLAEGLAGLPGVAVDPTAVETNFVMADFGGCGRTPAELAAAMRARGVVIAARGPLCRLVTHKDVARADIERVLAAFAEVMGAAA